ncbi:hypothetical protein GGR28_003778 [Lewinella aquimaris]|uniref:Uncharacterized protein n=1 Tax=Neolewinella aquimaris TaxID=1835722 RepID=A0A840E7J8_9BACT|nr:hypothetical protein [Neolewinella aquimaris]MBB4081131.1 hypothetical protein [Neolewinella aquimaris]
MSEVRIEDFSPLFGKVSVNFIGAAGDLYEKFIRVNEIDRQKDINHLGLLSYTFNTLHHTRYDYLMIQSVISELVENSFKGTTTSQGGLRIKGVNYGGNEILKTWFLLSNLGHCKHTIGDEKALMLHAVKRRGFKSYLSKYILDKDLKVWAGKVIDRFDYIKFHHIISLYRISKIFPRNKSKQLKYTSLYKLLLMPASTIEGVTDQLKLVRLKTLYSNIRTLSIIALDTQNSHLPVSIDILSTILSFDFNVDKFQGRKLSQLYDPLTNLLYDKLYLSTQAQTLQRSYEVRALNNLVDLSFKDIVETALLEGLSNPSITHLRHIIRKKYILAKGQKIKDHFNILQQIKSIDRSFESSIDFNSITRETVLDIYYETETFDINKIGLLLTHTVNLTQIVDRKQLLEVVAIHRPITQAIVKGLESEGIDNDKREKILLPVLGLLSHDLQQQHFRADKKFFKNISWSIIRLFIHDKFYFDLDNYHETTSFGIIYPDGTNELDKLIETEKEKFLQKNEDRVKELEHIQKATSRRFDGFTVACLDRIRIYDYSKPPSKRDVTDIDSLVIKFNQNELIVEFNETKNKRNCENRAKKDLNDKFVRILNSTAKGYRIHPVKKFGAKVRIRKTCI